MIKQQPIHLEGWKLLPMLAQSAVYISVIV